MSRLALNAGPAAGFIHKVVTKEPENGHYSRCKAEYSA